MGMGRGMGHRAQLRTQLRADLQNQREKAEFTPSGGGRPRVLQADRNDQRTRRDGEVGSCSKGRQRQSWELVGGYCVTRRGFGVPRPGWAP